MISAERLRWTSAPPDEHARTCPHVQRFAIAGIPFELRSDDAQVVDELHARFADHVTREEPQFRYYVFAEGSEYVFSCRHDGTWRWPHGPLTTTAIAFLADAAMIAALVHFSPGVYSMHAAAVCVGHKAAAIAGDSTAGKTTTLLACGRAGMQLYSDERALMREERVVPFLRRCSVREDARKRLLQDCPGDRLARILERTAQFSLVEAFGGEAVASAAPLRALFALNGYAEKPDVQEIDAAAALPAVSRWFDAPAGPLDRLGLAMKLLRDIRCYRLTLGAPGASAALIGEILQESP